MSSSVSCQLQKPVRPMSAEDAAIAFFELSERYPGVFRGRTGRQTFVDSRVQIHPQARIFLSDRTRIIGNTKIHQNARIYGKCTIIDSNVDGTILDGTTVISSVVKCDAVIADSILVNSLVEGKTSSTGVSEKTVLSDNIFLGQHVKDTTSDRMLTTIYRQTFALGCISTGDALGLLMPNVTAAAPVTTTWKLSGGCVSNGVTYDEEPPAHFLDLITYDLINDAVITPAGLSYDKQTLLHWMTSSSTDPSTRQPLQVSQLIPNRALQTMIDD